jgi:hypothetical protein
MFDNWFKSWEDMYSYKTFKQTINNYNQKVINFWKDFYNDVFNNIKKDPE